MTYSDALKRSVATFVVGATASPIASAVFDFAWWKAAASAGLTAVVNVVGRIAQAWLDEHPRAANARAAGGRPPLARRRRS